MAPWRFDETGADLGAAELPTAAILISSTPAKTRATRQGAGRNCTAFAHAAATLVRSAATSTVICPTPVLVGHQRHFL